jgi:long-subunit acyl-CoA synthetase (AMP-forming)
VKRFRLLPHDWEPGGVELTPTMKLKRKPELKLRATKL